MIPVNLDVIHLKQANTMDINEVIHNLETARCKAVVKYYDLSQSAVKGKKVNESEMRECIDTINQIDVLLQDALMEVTTTSKAYIMNDVTRYKKFVTKTLVSASPKNQGVFSNHQTINMKQKKPRGKDVVIKESTVQKVMKANKEVLLRAFKFKTTEECKSTKRSANYYMSKDDIMKVIDTNPDIKVMMPPKYKALSKNELCDELLLSKVKN